VTNFIAFLHTTAAYQAAVVQLMIGEANFAAQQLGLPETVPTATNLLVIAEVQPPARGVGGAVGTTNYTFSFDKGRLRLLRKRDWLKKISPPGTNLFDLTRQPSLLDTNGAHQLATQWLAALDVDVAALEQNQRRHMLQIATPNIASGELLATAQAGQRATKILTPLFVISWGERPPPRDFMNAARVKLLGSTKELLELDVQEDAGWKRPRLVVTNKAELLGPLPSPRHFIEELFGGRETTRIVEAPEQVTGFVLNSRFDNEESTLPEIRRGPVSISKIAARQLTKILLDFDTYYWGAMKLCDPDYGAKVRFSRGGKIVEVLFCFECDILEVTANGATRHADFNFNHNALAKIFKRIFPRDGKIQTLQINEHEREERDDLLRRLAAEMQP
jgi:hypothetical protein